MFSETDKAQIKGHGLSVKAVEQQIENFRKGFPSLRIVRAASVGDGILYISPEDAAKMAEKYDAHSVDLSVVKFVPASGAATRMFKELFEFVNDGRMTPGVETVMKNIKKFAFYHELKKCGVRFKDKRAVAAAIIGEGLNYGNTPKGLVTFHKYFRSRRKPVEEHLVEAAMYGRSGRTAKLHFTVSPEHEQAFIRLIAKRAKSFEKKFHVRYEIGFSEQKKSTDTIAVNPDFTPFRTSDGALLFRPAGHGALIENLNEIDADIIFVKNIDNVTTDSQRGDTVLYKKALASLLLDIQRKVFLHLSALRSGKMDKDAVRRFITEELCVALPEKCTEETMLGILDRPIRVCGMVRNEGEPGGGPFWVANDDGTVQLQIAESSQIAEKDRGIMAKATHFNPVDLICAVRRSDGTKFDLREFVDPSTGFISHKSSGGKELLAQELPGLWNGAMAKWNTVFAEVPITTFSPVKTVQDLLRPQHQPSKTIISTIKRSRR